MGDVDWDDGDPHYPNGIHSRRMQLRYHTTPPREKWGEFCVMCNCCAILFGILLTLAITLLSLVFLPKMTEDPKDIATDFYSTGDSRLLSFSSFFCKGIKVKTNLTATGLEQLLH